MDGQITAIEAQARRGGRRSNVFVEGRYAFSISTRLAEEKLHVGDAINAASVDKLLNDDQRLRCYDAAIRFLGVRPRSEREIRDRLAKHEFAPQIVDGVMEKLRRLDLVDDAAFAEYWIEQRNTHRPKGGRLLKQELRLKGVNVDVAAAALPTDENEEDGAYRAATRKAQSMRLLDERTFRQRLGAFLQRRGFSYETSKTVVTRLWNETTCQDSEETESGDWPPLSS